MVTGILFWLCVFGLVLPLSFLSAYGTTSKLVLLLGFAVGVASIPAYIAVEIVRIYRLQTVRTDG